MLCLKKNKLEDDKDETSYGPTAGHYDSNGWGTRERLLGPVTRKRVSSTKSKEFVINSSLVSGQLNCKTS